MRRNAPGRNIGDLIWRALMAWRAGWDLTGYVEKTFDGLAV